MTARELLSACHATMTADAIAEHALGLADEIELLRADVDTLRMTMNKAGLTVATLQALAIAQIANAQLARSLFEGQRKLEARRLIARMARQKLEPNVIPTLAPVDWSQAIFTPERNDHGRG